MIIDNKESEQIFERNLSYGFYFELSLEEMERRKKFLKEYERLIDKKRPNQTRYNGLSDALDRGFSDLRLFTGIVSKVSHITQTSNEEDFKVAGYDKNTNHLYLARELFSGNLGPKELSVLVYATLSRDVIDEDSIRKILGNDLQSVSRRVQAFIRKRVVPYSIEGILDLAIEDVIEERAYQIGGIKRPIENKNRIFEDLCTKIKRFLANDSASVTEFTEFIKKRKDNYVTSVDFAYNVFEFLGNLGFVNAHMHKLLEGRKRLLFEGDIDKLQLYNLDIAILYRYRMKEESFYDDWVRLGLEEFDRDYQQFIWQLRKDIEDYVQEFKGPISTNKDKLRIIGNLRDLNTCFLNVEDPTLAEVKHDLETALKIMT